MSQSVPVSRSYSGFSSRASDQLIGVFPLIVQAPRDVQAVGAVGFCTLRLRVPRSAPAPCWDLVVPDAAQRNRSELGSVPDVVRSGIAVPAVVGFAPLDVARVALDHVQLIVGRGARDR